MSNCNDEELKRALKEFTEASEEVNKFTPGVINMSHQTAEISSLEKLVEAEEKKKKAGKKYYTLLFKKSNCPEDKLEKWLRRMGYID